ncbi:MAG: glycoside hydrolase family 99-like domain-containing protein [Verrucomicrobiae bacterium]|nr:glycoside hydrolase family 99-like domain-containing protein [Verrucomicrobiae bacterium]
MNVAALGLLMAATVVREWRPEELARWSFGNVKNVRVADGVLQFETKIGDSMFFSPRLDAFPATPWQVVELVMRSDVSGAAECFWTNTTEGRYGGFSAQKRTPFRLAAGGWRSYRLEPYWQAEGEIVRLRFDLPEGVAGRYAVKSVRIIEQPPVGKVSFCAESNTFICVRMAAGRDDAGVVEFASRVVNGLHRVVFPVRADGRMHTYNIDMAGNANWRGEIVLLRAPAGAAVTAGVGPQGAADLEITFLGLQDRAARGGGPVRLEARVVNHGGETARNIHPQLKLGNARVLKAESVPEEVEFGVPAVFTWLIEGRDGKRATAEFSVGGTRRRAVLRFRPAAKFAAEYVPEPRPAHTDYIVGAYYYPGWHTAARWMPIRDYPERQPLLGWYEEGKPEVADWHIKWAVEHGIGFFLYDWYWDRGRRQLEHALHEGLFRARYQHLIKFCLLYANHNPQGSHSPQDFEEITRFWIQNYFRRPNYLTVDGKPVVVIFSVLNLPRDMGVEKVKPTFDRMRQMCREAGLGGLYLVACVNSSTNLLQKVKEQGYDAVTAYTWPWINMTPVEIAARRASFASCIEGYRRAWEEIASANLLPLIPPVFGGWDSRPWHGDTGLVRTGRTPGLFERHLRDCKAFLDRRGGKMLFIEAWNEWGEGSYIEPHREFGFGYLEAIRRVFAPRSPKPREIVPSDVGLGPYDVPEEPLTTAWTFKTESHGWTGNVANIRVADGALRFTTRGRDPALTSPAVRVRASQFPWVEMRIKASSDITGQLFWRTLRTRESEASSVKFPVRGDGRFHDIRLRVADNPRWRGLITGLRLDPGTEDGVDVAIEWIRLAER